MPNNHFAGVVPNNESSTASAGSQIKIQHDTGDDGVLYAFAKPAACSGIVALKANINQEQHETRGYRYRPCAQTVASTGDAVPKKGLALINGRGCLLGVAAGGGRLGRWGLRRPLFLFFLSNHDAFLNGCGLLIACGSPSMYESVIRAFQPSGTWY